MTDSSPVLAMRGIKKTFGGVSALDDVDLILRAGSVHALVGENGAGKSTLIKVMTGAYAPDAGSLLLDGKPVVFHSPEDAQALGVVAVHQEVSLLAHRTVAENVFLGREPHRFGFVDFRRMNEATRLLLGRLGLELDPEATLDALPIAVRQMVAIARGASLASKVLVLDEPTSSLPPHSVELLYDVIARMRAHGTALVYISHRFDEIDAVCDTITVLRDGRLVASRPLAGLARIDLVAMMLGRPPGLVAPKSSAGPNRARPRDESPPVLRAEDLRRGRALRGVSFDARAGEATGLAGLLGSGRTSTVRAVFGADPLESGTIRVEGEPVTIRSPRDAIRAGIALLPEDRSRDGIVPELSVRENLTLALLPRLTTKTRLGVLSRSKERAVVDRFMRRLQIKASSAEQKIVELSGGNQQKVLLARWLCRNPKVLLLDEPTRGIDIGAKMEIQELVDEMRAAGLALVVISSEIEELVTWCTRIVVLRDGRRACELEQPDIEADSLVHAIAGESS